ncbi:ATP-binding protein [Puniceicoccaceae bacterium K14]|nr:ATP-binding protein [Puniceicoccaceae bacterium K14]
MTRSKENRQSLKSRILIPLFFASGCMLSLLSYVTHQQAKNNMIEYVEQRSQMVANSVLYAIDTVSSSGALHRYITSIGAQPEISSVFVAGGEPLTVIACSEHYLKGSLVSSIDKLDIKSKLENALFSRERTFEVNEKLGIAIYSEPISLGRIAPGEGLGTDGAIVLVFGLNYFHDQLNNQFWGNIVLEFVVLIITIGIAYFLLVVRVHKPINTVINFINGFGRGEVVAVGKDMANDEIGYLAKVLEDSFLKERESSEKAKYFARNLQFQKDALDEHAIVSEADSNGSITYINKRFTDISGYELEELVGETHSVLNSSYHSKAFFDSFYESLNETGIWRGEIRNKAKDGSMYWVDSTIVAFKNEAGNVERYVSILNEITDRKNAEFDLVQAHEDIEKSLEAENAARLVAEEAALAKSQFLATMSHEIRTPMNGLIGVLHLLEEGLPAEKRKLFATAMNSADDLLVLINDILDFSKIEAGKMDIEHLNFDALELVEDVCELHAPSAHEKGIELICQVNPSRSYQTLGDSHRIRQIVSNLLSNAIKFTEKGEVAVALKLADEEEDNPKLRFDIIDSGIGVEQDSINSIFESFAQENSSTTRRFGGTGLGLAICKKLVELMGGSIGAESVLGKGSTFWFEIPLNRSDGEQLAPYSVADDCDERILALCCDDLVGRYLNAWSTSWGYSVTNAKCIEEVKELISSESSGTFQQFDYVLIDQTWSEVFRKEFFQMLESFDCFSNSSLIAVRRSCDDPITSKSRELTTLRKPLRVLSLLEAFKGSVVDANKSENAGSSGVVSYKHLNVLLVDDNTVNRMIAQSLFLQRHNLEVDTAENGEEAVGKISSGNYDLVFMDCMMPVMDGYDASRAIRDGKAGEANRNIPIIALTANAMTGDREACYAAGMSDYLPKPINPKEIAAKLLRWASEKHESTCKEKIDTKTEDDSPSSIMDLSKLLDIYGGDAEIIQSIFDMFLEEVGISLTKLMESVEAAEKAEDIRFHAHSIKGGAAEFGASRLSAAAAEMEKMAKQGALETIDKNLAEISSEFEVLKNMLETVDISDLNH